MKLSLSPAGYCFAGHFSLAMKVCKSIQLAPWDNFLQDTFPCVLKKIYPGEQVEESINDAHFDMLPQGHDSQK